MDDVDLANRHNAMHQAQALAAHRSRQKTSGPGSEVCLECGDQIPAERRELVAGCQRCVACQTEADNINRVRR